MKCLKILIVILLLATSALAQQVMSKAVQMNFVYLNIPNPISVFAENIPLSKIKIIVDNGTIEQQGLGSYLAMPKAPGFMKLKMYYKKKLIGEDLYYVRHMPQPTTYLGRIETSGSMNVAEFKAQRGLSSIIKEMHIDGGFYVSTFRFQIIRDGLKIEDTTFADGPLFSEMYKSISDNVQSGDEVLFSDFKIRLPKADFNAISFNPYILIKIN